MLLRNIFNEISLNDQFHLKDRMNILHFVSFFTGEIFLKSIAVFNMELF